jgi:hypothetical protein
MLRRHLVGLAALAAVAASFAACGGDSDSDAKGGTGGTTEGGVGGTSGAGGAVTDPTEVGKIPPAKPDAPPAAGTDSTVLAISQLFLGDTDRSGLTDAQAWKKFGFNLDGIISSSKGTNHCKPVEGATKTMVQPDGENGIDNSFGANLVPVIGALASNPSETISQSIDEGSFTIMVRLDKLEDPAAKPNQTAIAASLYGGADLGAAPTWSGNDEWPVLPELLNGGNIDDPKIKFPDSYLAGGNWVSGSATLLNLTLSISGFELSLAIQKAQIEMKVSGVGASASATEGTIGGVLATEQLIAELKKVAGNFDASLCASSAFEGIAAQIRQASDIMQDGTNGDPSKTCDGISIGLGFNAKAVKLGVVAPVTEPPPDPCAGS